MRYTPYMYGATYREGARVLSGMTAKFEAESAEQFREWWPALVRLSLQQVNYTPPCKLRRSTPGLLL